MDDQHGLGGETGATITTALKKSGCLAHHGWSGTLQHIVATEPARILAALHGFVPDAGQTQIGAWRESLHLLRACAQALIARLPSAADWGLVLEYEMPLESRRADAVLLAGAAIAVIEFKGKTGFTDPDIDQAHAYARDLRCYHDLCHRRDVVPVLVPTRSGYAREERRGVPVRGDRPPSGGPRRRLLIRPSLS